jgi:hypothetical protein
VSREVIDQGEDPDDYLHISKDIDRDIQNFDPQLQHLVVFDDVTHRNDKKNSNLVGQYYKYARPQNVSVIVVTHRILP